MKTYNGGSSLVGGGKEGCGTRWRTHDDAGVPSSEVIGPCAPKKAAPKKAPVVSATMEQHRRRTRSISAFLFALLTARAAGRPDPEVPNRLAHEVTLAGGLQTWLAEDKLVDIYMKKALTKLAKTAERKAKA